MLEIEDTWIETRGNGSKLFTEPYSAFALERLRKFLLTFQDLGENKYFSIHIDGETVVEKTVEIEKFNRYLEFVDEHTKKVEVRIYKGESFNCNQHNFLFNKGLSGVGQNENIEERISKAVTEEKMKTELQQLKIELKKKKKKLKKLKASVTSNENEKGIDLGAVTSFLSEGKGIIDAFRGGSPSLAGTPPPNQEPFSEVTIESADDPEFSEDQQIFNELFAEVGTDGIKRAVNIMGILAKHPDLEELLIKELDKKSKKDGKS